MGITNVCIFDIDEHVQSEHKQINFFKSENICVRSKAVLTRYWSTPECKYSLRYSSRACSHCCADAHKIFEKNQS